MGKRGETYFYVMLGGKINLSPLMKMFPNGSVKIFLLFCTSITLD